MAELISYVKGAGGKQNKAKYLVGKENIPAAVITRLITSVSGLSGAKLDRVFYQELDKYQKVLDVLEMANMSPSEAMETFSNLYQENRKPVGGTGKRATKAALSANVFSKGICKRFKYVDGPEKMFAEFLEVVNQEDFKKEVLDIITAHHRSFGLTSTGYVKTSGRKGNPAAQKALAKNRAEKAKAKAKAAK